MISSTKSIRFLPVCIFALLISVLEVNGQEDSKYEGPFQIGKYKGDATYGYRLVDTDTIFDGSFEFQRSNLSALIANEDVSFSFKGNFINNYPNGPWRFQFGEFQSASNSKVVDYEYRVSVSGIQETASGGIRKGKPHGQWVYEVDRIADSEVQDTLFRSNIEFDNGVPLRNFRMENEKNTLVGRFLRDGLAHDEWALYSADGIENSQTWYFNNGRLKKIQLDQNGENKILDVYQKDFKAYKTINLDKRFLNTLQVLVAPLDSIALKKGIPSLISENAGYYQKLDDILSELGESSFQSELKVKVPFYPLDSSAIAQMAKLKKRYKRTKTISDSLLNGTQLNILKRSDEEALFLHTALEKISEKFLDPLGTIVAFEEDSILQFTPFERLVAYAWPNGYPSKEIEVSNKESESRIFTGPNASQFKFSGNKIATMHQLADYAAGSVDTILGQLRPKLANIKRRQEFKALEKQMISQIKGLNAVIDSVKLQLPTKQFGVLKEIKMVADSSLGKYSEIERLDVKMDFGRGLVDCFVHLGELEKVILGLDKKKEEIDKTYEDQIWNPFMANLMTEEVKKRLTNAYAKVLLPYLINEASTNLNCGNAETLTAQFKSAHERMLELREADTRKLERKLKRERDPKVVMQLFNIEPLGNQEE